MTTRHALAFNLLTIRLDGVALSLATEEAVAFNLVHHPDERVGLSFSVALRPGFSLGMTAATAASAKDWPQWCGSDGKNMVSEEKGLPESFSPGQKRSDGTIDPSTASNVKWGVKLGNAFYSTPSVAGGKVFVGGLEDTQWDLRLLRRRQRQAALAMEGPAPRSAAQDRRLFHRHQRDSASDRSLLDGGGRRGPRLFRFQPLRRALPGCGRFAGEGRRRPRRVDASTCGRNWASFPAMPRTLLR